MPCCPTIIPGTFWETVTWKVGNCGNEGGMGCGLCKVRLQYPLYAVVPEEGILFNLYVAVMLEMNYNWVTKIGKTVMVEIDYSKI